MRPAHIAAGALGLITSGMAIEGAAHAQSSLAGKTVTITVPAGSGGTYHIYCQIVALHLGRHIPGNPSVILNNRPGAGGAVAASYMATVAPKDGTAVAMIAPGTITAQLARKVAYDATRFEWLGSIAARSSAIWVWHTKGVKTLKDLQKTDVTMGSTGFAAGGSVVPRLINQALGTKMKLVYGYKSGGAINVAIERGEVDGRWNFPNGFEGVRPTWMPEKKIIPIIAVGPRDPKRLPGLVHIEELLKPGTSERRLSDLIALDYNVGQAFYLPPDSPAAVVKMMRTAFEKMLADKVATDDIEKRRLELSPAKADVLSKSIKATMASVTAADIQAFKNIYIDKTKAAQAK